MNQRFADIADLLQRLECEHSQNHGAFNGNHSTDHRYSSIDRSSTNVALQLWLGLLPERRIRPSSRRGNRFVGGGDRISEDSGVRMGFSRQVFSQMRNYALGDRTPIQGGQIVTLASALVIGAGRLYVHSHNPTDFGTADPSRWIDPVAGAAHSTCCNIVALPRRYICRLDAHTSFADCLPLENPPF